MIQMSKRNDKLGLKITSPYILWSTLFIVIPLFLIVFFGFTKMEGGAYVFSLENFKELMNPLYYQQYYVCWLDIPQPI